MAYYSNTGSSIHTAAAGVGSDPGPSMAFQDGSLGVIQAFREGSLGQGRTVRAYKEGSLGSVGAAPGPSMAFQDGVLGSYGPGKLQSFRDGSLGQDVSEVPVLDMSDPAVVTELKTLMGMAPFMLPYLFGDSQLPEFGGDFAETFYSDPNWDERATFFATVYMQALAEAMGPDSQGSLSTAFVAPSMYPTSLGVGLIVSMDMSLVPADQQEALFASTPITTAFVADMTTLTASMTEPLSENPEEFGRVLPPAGALPPGAESPLSAGASGANMLVAGGVVVAALAAMAFAFSGKKRR